MTKVPYHFTVGKIECTVIQVGERMVDGRQMFGNVSGEAVETAVRARGLDPDNTPFSVNLLYMKTPEHNILVDSGTGEAAFLPDVQALPDDLRATGIEPEMIDSIIITHAHWDHIGGLMNADGDLTFPNAHYFMWKSEWDYWTAEENLAQMDANDPNPPYVRRILPRLRERITFLDDESPFLPGVCAISAPGHTVGQIALLFVSNGEGLLHIADAAHNPIQVDFPDWTPAYDPLQEASMQSRHKLVERAARDNLLLMSYHFAFPGVGRVLEEAGAFRWEAIA